jgi:hypothetical protein
VLCGTLHNGRHCLAWSAPVCIELNDEEGFGFDPLIEQLIVQLLNPTAQCALLIDLVPVLEPAGCLWITGVLVGKRLPPA